MTLWPARAREIATSASPPREIASSPSPARELFPAREIAISTSRSTAISSRELSGRSMSMRVCRFLT
jgi:hypothetical protein